MTSFTRMDVTFVEPVAITIKQETLRLPEHTGCLIEIASKTRILVSY